MIELNNIIQNKITRDNMYIFNKKAFFSALIMIIGVAMFTNPVMAQEQEETELSGMVVDASSQEAISGAQVMLQGVDKETTTGEDGAFTFEKVGPGTYTLAVSADGYKDWEQEVEVKKDGDAVTVKLQPKPKDSK
jgi:iron complex outermembrane receptor protein